MKVQGGGVDNTKCRSEWPLTFILFVLPAVVPCPVFALPVCAAVHEDIKYIDHLIDYSFIVSWFSFS